MGPQRQPTYRGEATSRGFREFFGFLCATTSRGLKPAWLLGFGVPKVLILGKTTDSVFS
jgi:hypothetical protein